MRPFGRCFLPGPTDVHPDVWAATQKPMYFAFSPRMQSMLEGMQPKLKQLFGTERTVMTATTAGTGLMEAAIRNGVRHRVLVVVGGYFGELFARVAEGCGKEVVRLHVPEGAALEPDQLAQFLDGPEIDAVALVHSESSTGALAPLAALVRVIHEQSDAIVLVDGVTSVGAMPVETDAWGLDFVFTGSQKALGLPPGIALCAASARFMARADSLNDRGLYFSIPHLSRAAERHLPLTTPALPVYHALECQLDRIEKAGGLKVRYARHALMARRMVEWTDAHPEVNLLAREGQRSPTVSALEIPPGKRPSEIVAQLEEQEYLIASGLPPLTDRIIRIGHMGDLELPHLDDLLVVLERVLGL